MNDPILTPDLAAIRARLAAATPGPWLRYGDGTYEVYVDADQDDLPSVTHGSDRPEDADLIAHAPTDLAALCDEVEWLRALGVANWDGSETAQMLHEARQHAEEKEARADAAEKELQETRADRDRLLGGIAEHTRTHRADAAESAHAESERQRARADAAEAAIARVRELHTPEDVCFSCSHTNSDATCPSCDTWCVVCTLRYPCATIRALDGEVSE